MSVWPWTDLISFVMRYSRPTGPSFRVLELGCGAGANIPFFNSIGVDYCAIEGSPTIVAKLHERFPALKEKIKTGDFTSEIPFEGNFELIFDRASLAHNNVEAIRRCIELARGRLPVGGKYIGIDWFSTAHTEFPKGQPGGDRFTRDGYEGGQFGHVGQVHFSDQEHLTGLFRGFEFKVLEHKVISRKIPADDHVLAVWNFVVEKKT